jgi:hypothetical protein
MPLLSGLNIEQCVRLVRLLGTYGSGGGNVPQKVPNLDRIDVSWPISSYAAEVLGTWPQGMKSLMERLRGGAREEDSGRLGKAFGGFYTALYKAFGAPEFGFLRDAFESYVAECWTGPIARRNRRLDAAVLDAVAWIPANHACRILEVSRRRLNQLVDEKLLRGERRRSARDREFLVVLKSDVIRLAPTVNDGLSLLEVAERLGLKRRRLAALLPTICPDAVKAGVVGCPWSIPMAWVERWETLIRTQPRLNEDNGDKVSLAHILRYWAWTDDQVGQLLVDIDLGRVVPLGAAAGSEALGALLLGSDQAKGWFASHRKKQVAEMTLPEVATKLDVKQEVVYALVRSGLMSANARRVGSRAQQRVASKSLLEFRRRHVFCRDVARVLGRSPRAVAAFLSNEGVMPVAGPGVDACRQLVFLREGVDKCLRRTGVGASIDFDLPRTSDDLPANAGHLDTRDQQQGIDAHLPCRESTVDTAGRCRDRWRSG